MPDFQLFFLKFCSTTTASKMAQIEAALAHLKALEKPNYAATARLFEVQETTLRRRFLGETKSIKEHAAERLQHLNPAQEEEILRYIDKLTHKHIPPTTQTVKNLAEELIGGPVGKNWASGFCRRHKDRISSVYLRPLDRARVASERADLYEHFYALVRVLCTIFDPC